MASPLLAPLPSLAGRRLWLTGGRGFIGSRVAALAEEAGATVTAFPGDVRDADGLRDHLLAAQPDLLLHLAAPVNVARDPSLKEQMDAVIVGGARNVRRAADSLTAHGRPLQLVLCGTCEEYGTIDAPFAEQDEPSEPVSPYAAAKLAATREALAAPRVEGLRIAVARPFLTYGPGQRPRQLVPALIDASLAGRPFPMTAGLQTRELNYIDDTALGLLRAVLTEQAAGRVVNIGGGEELAVVDLARTVVRLVGADADLLQPGALPTRAGEVPRFCSDPTLCRTLLGHTPSVSLEEGLRRTIAHARSERP
ncbi:MAG: NAD(P)-dependent oxidoreductase [Deltaproteobacteria bacterium]|nr:NAD(P)-dependent oxidoreductase [Deltaproteobacteria bacterium]